MMIISSREYERMTIELNTLRATNAEMVRQMYVDNQEKDLRRWIPVSERLPERNGIYITTCRDICENRVHAVGFDGVLKKWGRGGVVAWQPLPEPYKEGGIE